MGQEYTDVAVIGAGPYGLSLAAHLSARGVRFRIFGRAMETWRAHMPQGMYLKSPGCGSNLADPSGKHTLQRFCALNGWDYRDWDHPVSIEQFVQYGDWFQTSLVPSLEQADVVACSREASAYRLRLQDGESVVAKSVVVANGYRHSSRAPDELRALHPGLASHSSAHRSFAAFKGKNVIVVGAGQSALESATLLQESGASPLLVARCETLAWNPAPVLARTTYERLRHPRTATGTGLGHAFFGHPSLPFYYLPQRTRRRLVDTVLGPSGAWWLRERFYAQVALKLGWRLRSARPAADQAVLQFEHDEGTTEVRADHVIAATGYGVTPASFPFLSREIRKALRWEDGWPALSRRFESSAPGLHFIGFASARCFGPVMRFVAGVHVTAPRLADHLARRA